MKKITLLLLIGELLLTACSKATLVQTAIPTVSLISSPTITLTEAPSVPTIDVDGIQIPDPHITNPEFFDTNNLNSPIAEFAQAIRVRNQKMLFPA